MRKLALECRERKGGSRFATGSSLLRWKKLWRWVEICDFLGLTGLENWDSVFLSIKWEHEPDDLWIPLPLCYQWFTQSLINGGRSERAQGERQHAQCSHKAGSNWMYTLKTSSHEKADTSLSLASWQLSGFPLLKFLKLKYITPAPFLWLFPFLYSLFP